MHRPGRKPFARGDPAFFRGSEHSGQESLDDPLALQGQVQVEGFPALEGLLPHLLRNGRSPLPLFAGHQGSDLLVPLKHQERQGLLRKGVLTAELPGDLGDVPFQAPAVAEARMARGLVGGDGLPDLGQPPLLGRGGADDRDAELLRQERDVDLQPHPLRLVHDVHHQDHRQPRLHQLEGHDQHPLQVAGVENVEHHVGALGQENFTGNPLLFGDGQDGIHAGGVDDLPGAPLEGGTAPGDLHRGARIVGNRHIGPGQGIEEHALPHVGVSHQGHLPGAGAGRSAVSGERALPLE